MINYIINKLFLRVGKIDFSWRIIIPIGIIIIISCLTLKNTNLESSFLTSTFTRQLIWIMLGILMFFITQWFRIQFLHEYAYHLYLLIMIIMASTLFMPIIGGSQRWIVISGFSFQPSELGKLLLVFTLARFISDFQGKINPIKFLMISLSLALLPCLIIFIQPDFGTAIVYAFIVLPMLYWGGVRPFHLFSIIAPFLSIISAFDLTYFSIWMLIFIIIIYVNRPKVFYASMNFLLNIFCGILSPFIWNSILYPHQRDRILTLLNPMSDPQGAGYQIIQSMTAIGSGGFWGKGLGSGTQTQLRFLPVRDTDFIVSVIGEELGLFGIIILLISFSFIFYCFISYAETISNRFFSLSLIGFSSILFIHLIVNMGMTVGLFPVTGLPVPFLSYGGSFMLTCFLILGLGNNMINQNI